MIHMHQLLANINKPVRYFYFHITSRSGTTIPQDPLRNGLAYGLLYLYFVAIPAQQNIILNANNKDAIHSYKGLSLNFASFIGQI